MDGSAGETEWGTEIFAWLVEHGSAKSGLACANLAGQLPIWRYAEGRLS